MRGTLHNGTAELDWISFFDPENPEVMYRVCVTFILSSYKCMFGKGCPGLLNRGVRYDGGCCEQGVTFADEKDFANVEARVAELTEADCDNLDHVRNKGWYLRAPSDGHPYKTRKKNDRCIFANLEGGPAGKPGCSFHHLAERTGQRFIDTKPFICWTVPVAFDWSHEEGVDVMTINGFDASSWGGWDDGEQDDFENDLGHMGWWCMDTPDAFQHHSEPVWKSHEAELRKGMESDSAYERLVEIIHERGWDQQRTPTRMPGEVRNDGRPMLPLLIEERKHLTPRNHT